MPARRGRRDRLESLHSVQMAGSSVGAPRWRCANRGRTDARILSVSWRKGRQTADYLTVSWENQHSRMATILRSHLLAFKQEFQKIAQIFTFFVDR